MALLEACEPAVTVAQVEDNGCSCALDDLVVDVEDLIDAASDTLTRLTGGVMTGRCEQTYRPCRDCWHTGEWPCGCDPAGIPLPGVNPTVSEVLIDGDTFTDWFVLDDWKLGRTDLGVWPASQKLYLQDSEDGTFSITVESGESWNFVAQMAAIELVCEMARVLSGKDGQLPPGTVSATKDGVTIVVERLPGQADLEAVGLTWLARFLNEHGRKSIGAGRSPELTEGWRLHTVEFPA